MDWMLLWAASLLVPRSEREEWHREWRGELWHVRAACTPAGGPAGASQGQDHGRGQGQDQVTAFCLGAFQDALCLRRAGRAERPPLAGIEGTPRQCLLILAAMLAASYAIALLLPGVCAERSLWPRRMNPNLVMIEQEGVNDDAEATILPAQFRSWQGRKQKYFDGFAFYRVTRQDVGAEQATGGTENQGDQGHYEWNVAHAGANLFTLLGLPVEFSDADARARSDLKEVILSERTWKREFGADAHVAGEVVRFRGQRVRISGVAPDGALGLPGRVDAWMLESDPEAQASGAGYVVAHLTGLGAAEMWTQSVHIVANGPDGAEDILLGISLAEWKPAPGTLYLFAAIVALLALPAITSVSLGESSVNQQKTSWARRILRWSFFTAKAALLLPTIYFVSLDLAYGSTTIGRERAVYLELMSTFAMCLFSMRWMLKDQRQRCPVCLRTVTHPAQVGQASRTFLDWNGTEMMCMGGHTLLHVPSLPTSWFGSQRWLYLDTSWDFLFAGSTRPTP
jgi:hypothetical protein